MVIFNFLSKCEWHFIFDFYNNKTQNSIDNIQVLIQCKLCWGSWNNTYGCIIILIYYHIFNDYASTQFVYLFIYLYLFLTKPFEEKNHVNRGIKTACYNYWSYFSLCQCCSKMLFIIYHFHTLYTNTASHALGSKRNIHFINHQKPYVCYN